MVSQTDLTSGITTLSESLNDYFRQQNNLCSSIDSQTSPGSQIKGICGGNRKKIFSNAINKHNLKGGKQKKLYNSTSIKMPKRGGGCTVKKTKTKSSKKSRGGGSDWLSTHNSRGSYITSDDTWYNGENLFKQFSKTGEYIPNSKLGVSASPILSGNMKDMSLPPQGDGFDPYASTLGKIGGSKKKSPAKKKSKKNPTKKVSKKSKKVVKRAPSKSKVGKKRSPAKKKVKKAEPSTMNKFKKFLGL